MFADSDEEDDMFATARAALRAKEHATATDDDGRNVARRTENGADHAEPSTSQPPGREPRATASAQPVADVDYSSWPVKELKRFLTERGEVPSDQL